MFRVALLAATVALVACGGGGSGAVAVAPAETPPVVTASAEGFWGGAASNGTGVTFVVLETGETWGLYAPSAATIIYASYGNTSVNGTSVSSSGTDFSLIGSSVFGGGFTGSVATKSSLNVTTFGGVSSSSTYVASYDQPPSLASLTGNYSGTSTTGRSPPVSIAMTMSALGVFSSVGLNGCAANGTATPRPSGKNVFNISVTFTGASCALGDGSLATGIAIFNPLTRQIVLMAMNAAKSDGYFYYGTR
jgi:hypothetical protein